jgi:hypothetical protein
VLGASAKGLAALLSKEFLKLVVLSCVIAFPVSWYLMSQWLQNFPYRTAVHWWVFAIAAITSLFIALITVSVQALKAALTNPVDTLRTE